jgi:hypothetical protein
LASSTVISFADTHVKNAELNNKVRIVLNFLAF